MIPFHAIHDDDPDRLFATARAMGGAYRRNKLARQAFNLELHCETAGMQPQLYRVAEPYSIPVYSSGGFDSTTARFELSRRICTSGRYTIILHVPALSARERAALILRAWKQGELPDPKIRAATPREQASEYNELLRRVRAVNGIFAHATMVLEEQVNQLPLLLSHLVGARLFAAQMGLVSSCIAFGTNEPITEWEYLAQLAEERERFAPVAELGVVRADGFEDWQPSDFVVGGVGVKQLTDRGGERARRLEEKRLRGLVESGVLTGRGKGRSPALHTGSFFAWAGEEVPVYPAWAPGFDVRPDDVAGEVTALQVRREQTRQVIQSAAGDFARVVLGFEGDATDLSWSEVVSGIATVVR